MLADPRATPPTHARELNQQVQLVRAQLKLQRQPGLSHDPVFAGADF
jgi:hypothetical protein